MAIRGTSRRYQEEVSWLCGMRGPTARRAKEERPTGRDGRRDWALGNAVYVSIYWSVLLYLTAVNIIARGQRQVNVKAARTLNSARLGSGEFTTGTLV